VRSVAHCRGYSIVEVVLVVVILAIIGTLAGPRFFDNAAVDERRYAEELASALRYAQKIAVASGCRVRVDIGVSDYALTQQAALAGHCDASDANYPVPVRLSTGEVMTGTAPTGVITAPSLALIYNPLGQTSLAADQALAVGSRTVTIAADSGLVRVP
jgi:MSHA pilin protein MshC